MLSKTVDKSEAVFEGKWAISNDRLHTTVVGTKLGIFFF